MKTLKDIEKTLKEALDDNEVLLNTLKKCVVNKKKDGSEFKKLSQALVGGKIGSYSPIEDKEHPYITVYYEANGRYTSYSFPIYIYMDELKDGDPRKEGFSRQFVRMTYKMNNEEVREEISRQIEIVKKQIDSYKKQLAIAEVAYNNYKNAIEEAEKALKSNCSNNSDEFNLLYSEIKSSFR